MNIRQLKFVETLARTHSFTVAANECCVTQPTLSNAVAQLEDELGEKLFIRSTRTVKPTEFAQHLLPHIMNLLEAENSLLLEAESFLKPEKQLIRIGTSPLINSYVMNAVLEAFRNMYPDVEVVLREGNMKNLHHALESGLLDFVFGIADPKGKKFSKTFLYEEPLLYLSRSRSNTLNEHNKIEFKDISHDVFIMVPDACGLARTTRDLFKRQRKKLNEYSGQAMSYQVLAEWAELGIGSAIIPQSKISKKRQAAYTITDKSGNNIQIAYQAFWAKASEKKPHLSAFITHLKSVTPQIIDGLA